MMLTGMISVGGNGLAARVFYLKRNAITIPEIFLLNIALVDLLLTLVSYPAFIISAFGHHWMFGETGINLLKLSTVFIEND